MREGGIFKFFIWFFPVFPLYLLNQLSYPDISQTVGKLYNRAFQFGAMDPDSSTGLEDIEEKAVKTE